MKKRAIVICVAAVVLIACLILMKLIKTDDGALHEGQNEHNQKV